MYSWYIWGSRYNYENITIIQGHTCTQMNWNHDLKQYQQLQAHCNTTMGSRDTAVTYTLATVWTDKEKIAHMHDGILFYEKGQWIFSNKSPHLLEMCDALFF